MTSILTDEDIDKIQAIVDSVPDYFEDEEEIQCPHCGDVVGFTSDDAGLYSENGFVHTCNECKKVFTIYGSMNWSWSTEKNSDV